MATLQALAISGIRSYHSEKLQRIDFTHPLTLINGKNGSGKTTIIECLKYITTGVLPPQVNRENCFVMDPSIAGTPEVRGDIRLRFRTAKNRVVIAKKIFMVTKTEKKLTSKALQQSLKTKDQDGKQIQVSQRCADIEKQIPEMLGISKAILNNIVFCHQDDSLWPFSDNNVLKNIFDELFDTKRFTKTLENMKDALKDYEKQRLELKGQLQFLKSSYYKISQNHAQVLHGLIEVVQASEQLQSVRAQLQPLKTKIKQLNMNESQKNQYISKKGVLEYKIIDIQQKIRSLKQKMRDLVGTEIPELGLQQGKKKMEEICLEIEEKQKEFKMLEKIFEEIRDREAVNKRKNQFLMEVKRIKEIMPEIRDIGMNSGQEIIQLIRQKIKKMKASQKLLKEAREKYNKIQSANLPSPSQIQKQRQDTKALLTKSQKSKTQLQSLQRKIRSLFTLLYNPNISPDQAPQIPLNSTKHSVDRLPKLQAQIELKKAQLKKYQQMKPKNKSLHQEIYQIRYTGIQLQKQMYEYMTRRQECGMCMKKLNDEDLLNIKAKMQKTVKKSEARIEELKRMYRPEDEIDPKPIIEEIEKFIEGAVKTMRVLEDEKGKYDKAVEQQAQAQLNKELNKLMASLGLKSASFRSQHKIQWSSNQGNIQKFRQLCNEYRITLMQNKNAQSEHLRSRQKLLKFEQLTQQSISQKQSQQKLQQQIIKLELQVRDCSIIENIYGKIQELWRMIKREEEKGSSSEESSGELGHRLAGIESVLGNLRREKLGLEIRMECCRLSQQKQQLKKQLTLVIQNLQTLSAIKSQNSLLQTQKSTLLLSQAKLLQKISIKRTLHTRYLSQQPTYLAKLLRYNTLSSLISDMQTTTKAMERATNRLHNEKMDQINKILFDIWQEVYHAKDIEFIRINSVSEKKGSGYGYSIMMQKNKQLIEMKGRCSMGQKVLASLIIRMALAQAFSASTHILTLDEPTTNLDRIHIQNLAQSISTILQMEHNSRLQLIIISHDMQFISLLKKHTSCYYEIGRNQKNFSTIKKKDISELGKEETIRGLEAIHY